MPKNSHGIRAGETDQVSIQKVLSDVESVLKKHNLWYQVELIYKAKGLDMIKIKEISIKQK